MAEHMLPALQFHPLADLFPLLEGAEFDELVADVRAHGVREPVWIHGTRILDGRNRYRAAQAADVECPTRTYDGDGPVEFVISLNLKRRHLSESQRAMVAAKLANLKDGQRADLVEGLPIGRASGLLNVGERTVARAREVREHGVPELVEAVERGTVSVAAAADIASQPLEEQHQIVARGEREILEAAKAIRAKNMEERRSERIARLAAISNCDAPLPQDRKYPVILADPPCPARRATPTPGIQPWPRAWRCNSDARLRCCGARCCGIRKDAPPRRSVPPSIALPTRADNDLRQALPRG